MPRQRKGYVYYDHERKSHTARLTYTDATGKVRTIKRQVANKTEGNLLLKKLLRDLEDGGARILDGEKMTFHRLAQEYEKARLFAPIMKDGMRVAGLKSYKLEKARLITLSEHFGQQRMRFITHADLEKFKIKRLETPTAQGGKRAIASVNRELALLRNVFNFARRQGWIMRNPFEQGEPILSKAQENQRDRVLSREEEKRLLTVCTGNVYRDLLRAILICALDTAMRRGEMFKLQWKDVDLEARQITVRPENSKTERPRTIGISSRLLIELQRLYDVSPDDPQYSVFGIKDNVKKSFAAVLKEAGIEDFRLHDCRHTAITRMIQTGMPPLEVMKISGHTQMSTFLRYLNLTADTARSAANAIDQWHALEEMAGNSDYIN